jgi:hypothetical protein
MLGDTPPAVVYAKSDYGVGHAEVAPAATSVTIRLVANVELSGTVRDARGPLPLVNSPWVSFGGPGAHWDPFTGDSIRADGTYYLTTQPGTTQTLTITDLPDFEENGTEHHQATATMPKVWEIRATLDMPASRNLDLTIPDAAPVNFRAVDTDGRTLPVTSFGASSTHTITIAPGLTGTATAESYGPAHDGRFQHMMFGPAEAEIGFNGANGGASTGQLPLTPGRQVVLAAAAPYTAGTVVIPEPTTTTTTTPPSANDPAAQTSSQGSAHSGYWALASDGSVYHFGAATHLGNAAQNAVDLEPTPTGNGYWALNRNGQVQPFGDATELGDVDMGTLPTGEEPASLSATPSGKGYWVFTNRGRVLPFGDAAFLGDMSQSKLNGAVLGSVATPSGKGYYMVASDGGIFAFGDAAFAGSMGGKKLNAPVQSLVPDADGKGYWLVASDGGIFAFDAPFRGSMGATKLNKPVVGMVRYGDGYLMVGADGGIFNFSTSPFAGSLGDKPPASPVVAVAALP